MFSDSFAGIAPISVPGFITAQMVGAVIGIALHRTLGLPHDGCPGATGVRPALASDPIPIP